MAADAGLGGRGEILSPRLYIGGSGPWKHRVSLGARPDSIASAVAAFQATGHDFIKISGEHGEVYDPCSPRHAG